ncbi:hypothetical protein QUF54_08460, partial [Candidatus Marithioploca araucensis]|nr:hypothetical protein [Candidatus Marithioploca araucensis]
DDLLDEEELNDYKKLIEEIIEWFAFEIEKYRKAGDSKIDITILYDDKQPVSENEAYIRMNHSDNNTCVNVNLVRGKIFNPPAQNFVSEIKNDFKLKLKDEQKSFLKSCLCISVIVKDRLNIKKKHCTK